MYNFLTPTEKECNPGMFGMMEGFGNATTTVAPPTHTTRVTFDTTNIIGLVVWLLCILYNCISSAVEVSKITQDNSEKRGRCFVSIPQCSVRIPSHYHISTVSITHSIALTFHFPRCTNNENPKLILVINPRLLLPLYFFFYFFPTNQTNPLGYLVFETV